MNEQDVQARWIWLDRVAADPSISASAFRVAYGISTFINTASGIAWPTQATLAKRLGLVGSDSDTRALRNRICELRAAGYLLIQQSGRGHSNRYRLAIPLVQPSPAEDDRKSFSGHVADDRKKSSGHVADERKNFSGQMSDDRKNFSAQTGKTFPAIYINEPTTNPPPPHHTVAEANDESRIADRNEEAMRDASLEQQFERFQSVYPFDNVMDRAAARREFAKLSDVDRQEAIAAAGPYRIALGGRPAMYAARWLSSRAFSPPSSRPQAGGASAVEASGRVFVAEGGAEWQAWLDRLGKLSHPVTRHPETGVVGWFFPATGPPAGVA